MRAYSGGLRISVRDELDNDVLLDVLRFVLKGVEMPSRPFATDAPPPRRS